MKGMKEIKSTKVFFAAPRPPAFGWPRSYILAFFPGRLHDFGKPSPLAHGIGISDCFQRGILSFENPAASQMGATELHVVPHVLHVEVHVERHKAYAAACQLDGVVSTCKVKWGII